MTLHHVKQLVNELSNIEKMELRDYLDAVLVDVHQHPSDELSERDQMNHISDIWVQFDNLPPRLSDDEEKAMMQMLHEATAGQPPLSDVIIAEREDRL